jgi:hypothetical protein
MTIYGLRMQGKYSIICTVKMAFGFEHDRLIMIIQKDFS